MAASEESAKQRGVKRNAKDDVDDEPKTETDRVVVLTAGAAAQETGAQAPGSAGSATRMALPETWDQAQSIQRQQRPTTRGTKGQKTWGDASLATITGIAAEGTERKAEDPGDDDSRTQRETGPDLTRR